MRVHFVHFENGLSLIAKKLYIGRGGGGGGMINMHSAGKAQSEPDKDTAVVNDDHYEEDDASVDSGQAQEGVKRIEAISQTWTKWSLIVAYVGYASVHSHHHSFQSPAVQNQRLRRF